MLLISIYMFTDGDVTNLQTYQKMLRHVSDAIHILKIDNVIIGGDINSDFLGYNQDIPPPLSNVCYRNL